MAVESTRPVETGGGQTARAAAEPVSAEEAPPSGPAAAAMLAAGFGALTLGILTTLAEGVTSIKDWLQFNDRVGPLSGKTIISVIVFFVAWGLLTAVWRRSDPPLQRVAVATAALVILGLVGTFPIFFQAFS